MAADDPTNENMDLETFFSLNPDLLCVADSKGNFKKVNKAWVEFLGHDLESLEGSTFMDFVHPDDQAETLEVVDSLFHKGPVFDFINRFRHKDGSYRFLEWHSISRGAYIYAAARDITDRKKAEEKIRQLSKAVDYNPASVIITNPQGTIEYVNKKFTSLTGYDRKETEGKNPRILKSGMQDDAFYADMWKTLAAGETWQGNFHNRKKNGELYWESALIAPILNNDGDITHYVAVKEDITAKKEAEDELKKREELLDLFFHQSLDGFFFMMLDEPVEWNDSVDKDTVLEYVFGHHKITRINQAMLDQYRAGEADFLGLTPVDLFAHDIEHGKQVWKQFFDEGKLHIDTQEQKFDGSPMLIEGDYICIYDNSGRITGHFGIQREVTFEREAKGKLQESEEKFRQLAENIDQVFFLRTEREMIYVSPAYEKIWGRTCESLYKHPESYMDAIHPEDKDTVLEWYHKEGGEFSGEYRILKPDGTVRWISASLFHVKEESIHDEKPRRMAGIAQDITERKVLEQKLRESSIRDTLTGLYNRRYIYEMAGPLVEKAKRKEESFSIALLDIDFFKAVNDTYGHLAGDMVLKDLAALLGENTRKYDLAGRYGGEEFIIVFPGVHREQAKQFTERILEKVRELRVLHEGREIRFTFSCGISDSRSCEDGECTLEILINEADERLYKAKSSGRNRVL